MFFIIIIIIIFFSIFLIIFNIRQIIFQIFNIIKLNRIKQINLIIFLIEIFIIKQTFIFLHFFDFFLYQLAFKKLFTTRSIFRINLQQHFNHFPHIIAIQPGNFINFSSTNIFEKFIHIISLERWPKSA